MSEPFLELAARGRTTWWRWALTAFVGLVLAMIFGAVVMLIVQATGRLPADIAAQMTKPQNPAVFFVSTGVIFGCVLAGYAVAARMLLHKRFLDVTGPWDWRLVLGGAGVWSVVVVAAALIDLMIAPHGFRFTAGPRTAELAVYAVVALAPQVFAEEFVFRGLVTQGFMLALKRAPIAALLSGVVFGAIHIPNGLPQAASATIFGVCTSWMAIRLGGIAFTTGLHLANNVFGAVVIVSANDVFGGLPGLFAQDTPGLMWFDVAVMALAQIGLLVAVEVAARRSRQQPPFASVANPIHNSLTSG